MTIDICTLVWPLFVNFGKVNLPPPSFAHLFQKMVCAKFFTDRITLRRAANALKISKASPLGIFFKYGNNIIRDCVALCFAYEIIFNYREIMCV